ncbi:uncharacterized protein LOC129908239 [Episyrphus balteatus]|uniref:uncharacterized protein LOC129908239 n=1 Tax=Episyrphus balteatus TaxID=286459 RepID=UPI002486C381|nr:uncharacterized protein LOC129908239 [Episyrphus balteatus]
MHRDIFGGEGYKGQTPPPGTSSIGVNLRVTGHCSQGGRKYMEDFFSVAYHESENANDLEYAFVGIYDGHGGSEAAMFAKEHLMMGIINQKLFWSDSDQDVLRAIREGYIATHYAMWREQEKWPKTATGLPSTAGTTATVAFIRHEKIYIGHVGDSGIVLGYQNSDENFWRAKQLTLDHKPESVVEKARIMDSGGKVVAKSGVPRVVWNRPRNGHKGPVRRSTAIDEIPFLAVARSLGDLWSYNSALNKFIVSPDPDVKVIKINPNTFRCLIFGTDGLWNVVSPEEAVDTVRDKEIINEHVSNLGVEKNAWCNPSKGLVDRALKTWSSKKMRADNTSVVTVILYPPRSSTPKPSLVSNFANGLHYIPTDAAVNTVDGYSQNCSQRFPPTADCNHQCHLYDTDILDETHQLPHYETIASSPVMRQHLQHQLPTQNGYMQSCFDRNSFDYAKNYQINCDNNRYLYYDDHGSNTYVNSFAESYNSLLNSSLEREDSSLSNGSIGTSDMSSDESNESDPSKYHSYDSLHHTGLAGHDRVQHHYPNNEYQIEQQLYQEQCMSAEEGYSLTKLETRVEQQLRGDTNEQMDALTSVQSFQIFGGATSETQFSKNKNKYQKEYNGSDISDSNFLCSFEDNARSYEPNIDDTRCRDLSPPLPENVIRTTSLSIERLDTTAFERLNFNSIERPINTKGIEADIKMLMDDTVDETIQIYEISSSVVEVPPSPPGPPELSTQSVPKAIKEPSSTVSHENFDFTPLNKPSAHKVVLYPNVPNENHRKPRDTSIHQHPRTFEKRMLRSMTVDYSKRTLRSRNILPKDMKLKSTPSTNLRRSTIVQNNFIKSLKSSNAENSSSLICKKSLTLRSREIKLNSGIWSESNDVSRSSSSCSQKQKRNSNLSSFCDSSDSTKESITTGNKNDCMVTPTLRKSTEGIATLSTSHHLQQQVSVSFAKRSNLRNSRWGPGKTTMLTRNRVQKRMTR